MKKSKPTKAQRELAASWEALQQKWNNAPKFARTTTGRMVKQHEPPFHELPRKRTPEAERVIKSLSTPGGSTAPAPAKVYTGTEIVGLATMHKSNIVPIFNTEAAKEVAAMRR